MGYVDWIRGCVGHRKIFLAFASVVLRNHAGRILLQRRTDFNWWGLPGGSLERGEGLRACARRELREETGLSAGDLSLVGIYTDPRLDVTYPNGDRVQQFTVCFTGRANGGSLQVDGTENSEQRFFSAGELPYDQIPPHYRAMLKDALGGGPPAFTPPYRLTRTRSQLDALRPRIGSNRYIGVGACAVVRDGAGRLLLSRSSDQSDWAILWGFMRLGENAAWAARRLVRQASGYEVSPQRLLGVYTSAAAWPARAGENLQAVFAVFECRIANTPPNPKTNSHLTWMAPGDLAALPSPPALADLHRAVIRPVDGEYFIAARSRPVWG